MNKEIKHLVLDKVPLEPHEKIMSLVGISHYNVSICQIILQKSDIIYFNSGDNYHPSEKDISGIILLAGYHMYKRG